ncbi:aminotransferase class IV [Corynebacterium guangdongense]|uniref:Branched-subunit amino acid aminotransferase/4-amino-4-deoxychorismate lyase n=1 Tax=Corynebacterium guangdongense TaxID=1783348 RepID=A0ABU1ZV30_9CORY|nr:aminotransferase class IV [Corynebacterium guangdongense]MDR7328785.1 branched-subunit amino acid aminotransferase/4-amino-4-deoxychorismate lyase [Corynebacterium guangdongense]WJZ17360.1 hypothetical protein CGUA_03840 [Corynebacterium guangdongense]
MSEHVTTFAVEGGRTPNLGAHLARISDGASVSPHRMAQIREELGRLGGDDYRAVITGSEGQATVIRRPLNAHQGNIVAAIPVRDERRRPLVKGPDMGWQNQQVLLARSAGAHDSLLQTDDGAIVSSLRSALLVFPREEPNTVLYSGHPKTTPSVTLEATLDWLRGLGITARRKDEGFSLKEIFSGETWTLNSVFGIRRIDHWMEYRTKRPATLLVDGERGLIPTAEAAEAARWARAEEI